MATTGCNAAAAASTDATPKNDATSKDTTAAAPKDSTPQKVSPGDVPKVLSSSKARTASNYRLVPRLSIGYVFSNDTVNCGCGD